MLWLSAKSDFHAEPKHRGYLMKQHFLALSFGVGAMLLATQYAFAQDAQNCAPRDRVLARLAENYGETRQSIGLAPNNHVVEVFASEATGTWTIIATLPTGQTCLVASGQSYEPIAEALPAPGNDA